MENKILIYTFSSCPYCLKAKQLLEGLNLKYEEIVITREDLQELKKKTNYATVPQIFIDDQLIGGSTELEQLIKDGKFNDSK